MLTLYYATGTIALASHIALEDANAKYKAVGVSFKDKEQQAADYLKINPKGRVPALVTDSGILTETPAILVYIAQLFPESTIALPDDPFEFAKIQSFNSYLCSTVHVAHAHRMRGYRWADDADAIANMKSRVPHVLNECFQLIEDEMLVGPWVMGDRYSICDPYLYTLSGWLEGDGVDIAKFPKVNKHSELMAGRDSVIAALDSSSRT